MPTYLYLHKENDEGLQKKFRGVYELRHVDYELSRTVNNKGEIMSDIRSGDIRVVIDGFGDETLFNWLFGGYLQYENGEVVTMDEHERVIEKFSFGKAQAQKYRLHYDANAKNSVASSLTIEAREITTDKELYYESK